MIKIITFNVNGINSFIKHIETKHNLCFNDYLLNILKVDILCLQEIKTKIHTNLNLKDYITFTNLNKYKNGIYGISTIVKKSLYCRKHTIIVPYSDHGRSILTDHKNFKLLNLYFPVDGGNFKFIYEFYEKIKEFINKFDDMIVVGDFNAVYSVFDHYIYYNEYLKLYKRKELFECTLIEKEQSKTIEANEIIETFDFFKDENDINFKKNWKILNNDTPIEYDIEIDIYKILGSNMQYFLFNSINSLYLNFLKNSLQFLKDIKIVNINNYNLNQYNIDLIERNYKSITKLDYFVSSPSILILLLYGTYQRNWFIKLILKLNYIDIFRIYHTNIKYTCWNTQLSLRNVNLGTRLDYILIPIKILKSVVYSDILDNVYGSDHCPVFVLLDIKIEDDFDNCLKIKNNLNDYFKLKKSSNL